MMQATVIKTFESDYIINIDENESDIPEAPFSCWVVPMEEMNVYSLRVISAEARAAQLQAERDSAAYQATCEAARVVYDVAQVYKDAGDRIEYSALIQAFNKICEALK